MYIISNRKRMSEYVSVIVLRMNYYGTMKQIYWESIKNGYFVHIYNKNKIFTENLFFVFK